MAAAGGKRQRDRPRFVYVTRFGSHQCGSVLHLGGRGAEDRWSPGLEARGSQEEPRGAAAGDRGGGELPPGSEPEVPAASSAARASSARSGGRSAARADSTQKILAEKFEFPLHFNETSKIMKKKKKAYSEEKLHPGQLIKYCREEIRKLDKEIREFSDYGKRLHLSFSSLSANTALIISIDMQHRSQCGKRCTRSFLECSKKMNSIDSGCNAKGYLVKTQIAQDESSYDLDVYQEDYEEFKDRSLN